MRIATYRGFVENGQVRLVDNVRLPEKATVFVVVPDPEISAAVCVRSPRLARPEQAGDFEKEVVFQGCEAGV
jgi:hypothetical protein